MPSRNHNLVAGGPHYYTLRPDSDVGGEVYERALLQRLPRHGVDVVIGAPRGSCAATLSDGVRVDTLRHDLGLHWVAAPTIFVPYVVGLLRRREVDLLRGHSVRYCGPSLLLARRVARSRVPVVLHHHHLTPRWRTLELALLRQADGVVTVSEFSKRELVDAGVSPSRVHVIANGVQRPTDAGGAAPTWPSSSGLRLLYLGRLETRKRPSVALDALISLHRRGVDASLVVAGAGDALGELEARAQSAGVSDRVAFLGRVSEEQKWLLYEHADILLFPSALEGFGLVVAEAQASGLPAVAARGTAASEALDPGRSGLLAAPTGDAFADAITTELDSSDRRAGFGQHARSYAARFDWDRAAAATASLYRELVDASEAVVGRRQHTATPRSA